MIGLSEQAVQSYVPVHLRDVALRLIRLGYDVNYFWLEPNPKKGRDSARESIRAVNADFVQVRMTIIWAARGALVKTEGSVRRRRNGEQEPLRQLPDVEDFWAFAEKGARSGKGEQGAAVLGGKAG